MHSLACSVEVTEEEEIPRAEFIGKGGSVEFDILKSFR